MADNKFLLVSAADGSETVPYTLSFTGAARRWRCQYQWTAVDVCLTPTFKAWADAKIKGGDFSDVLTFTITTQS